MLNVKTLLGGVFHFVQKVMCENVCMGFVFVNVPNCSIECKNRMSFHKSTKGQKERERD